jgi:hypothetical protein
MAKRKATTEADRKRAKEWAAAHPERMRELCRKYAAKPDKQEMKRKRDAAYREANRERERARGKRYREMYPERVKARQVASRESRRAYLVKRAYGLPLEEYNALLARQGNCCAICRGDLAVMCGKRRPHVDHCHDTGTVRGILCTKCNAGIGMLRDDPALLRAALAYLESASSPTPVTTGAAA